MIELTSHRTRRRAAADGRPASSVRHALESSATSSTASSGRVRKRMQAQRTRDTAPELAVRRRLHAAGLRYRVDRAPMSGLRRRADIVFGPTRVAVFIDGCFWHGCPSHGTRPSANAAWWQDKLARNRVRDAETDTILVGAGWAVIRAWEHDPPEQVALLVQSTVQSRLPRRDVGGLRSFAS